MRERLTGLPSEAVGKLVSSVRRVFWHNLLGYEGPYYKNYGKREVYVKPGRRHDDVFVDALDYLRLRLRLPRMPMSTDDLMGMLPKPKEETKPLLSERDVMDILQGKDILKERK